MADIITIKFLGTIFLSAVLPTLLWLFFWLRESRFNPEPPGLLVLTFIAGIFGVFLVMPVQSLVTYFGIEGTEKIFIFGLAEEVIKFLTVLVVMGSSSVIDEPIDYAIYLITGAAGFATAENVLFMVEPALNQNISFIVETGTLRFLGASILHTVLAALLGLIIGFVFYKSRWVKFRFAIAGIGIVTILHTFFNSFIIKYVEINGLLTLAILWLVTLFIIAMFERVRRVTR